MPVDGEKQKIVASVLKEALMKFVASNLIVNVKERVHDRQPDEGIGVRSNCVASWGEGSPPPVTPWPVRNPSIQTKDLRAFLSHSTHAQPLY